MSGEELFFYANGSEVGCTAFDASIRFLRRNVVHSDKAKPFVPMIPHPVESSTAEVLTVSMSLSHLKAMLPALLKTVERYEKEVGHIPLPADVEEFWKNRNSGEAT